MTSVDLLNVLKAETIKITKDILMPVNIKSGEAANESRSAKVHLMRLPDEKADWKKAPYVIHQAVTGNNTQVSGQPIACRVDIRSVFCVYSRDQQEGELMLLNLMERIRLHLLEQVVIGKRYELDLAAGLQWMVYPDTAYPYHMGEMVSTWKLPKINRKVDLLNGY